MMRVPLPRTRVMTRPLSPLTFPPIGMVHPPLRRITTETKADCDDAEGTEIISPPPPRRPNGPPRPPHPALLPYESFIPKRPPPPCARPFIARVFSNVPLANCLRATPAAGGAFTPEPPLAVLRVRLRVPHPVRIDDVVRSYEEEGAGVGIAVVMPAFFRAMS